MSDAAANGVSKPQKRVFLWAVPRSISTAFFRAMMNKSNIKVLMEPYAKAYYYGEERISKRYESEPIHKNATFADIKKECESEFAGHGTVFVKDMAYYLTGRLSAESLPSNYIHTFLIRDPRKAVMSLYRLSVAPDTTGWNHFDAAEAGYKELLEVYTLVTEKMGQKAIVVDADDLLHNPDSILRQFCQKTGVEFEERMLNWDEAPADLSVFSEWMPWFEGVLTSNSFKKAHKSPNPGGQPQYVQKCIEECLPIYNKMYSSRIIPL